MAIGKLPITAPNADITDTDLVVAFQTIKTAHNAAPGFCELVASVALTPGKAVNINNGQLRLADKDLGIPAVGICLSTANAGAKATYVLFSGYTSGKLSGLVANTVYYLGAAGAMLNAKPGVGLIQALGIALSATEFMVAVSLP